MNAKPISETAKSNSGCGTVACTLFGAIIFLAGSFFFWILVVNPVSLWNQAKQWPAADATILTSKVAESHDSEGSSYRPSFTYDYTVDGKKFTNDRYGLLLWSGNRKHAVKIQKQHPRGSQTPVYYDPTDPGDSLMNRKLGWIMLFGLFPLTFMTFGAFLMWGALTGWSAFKSSKPEKLAEGRSTDPESLPSGLAAPAAAMSSKKQIPSELDADKEDHTFDGPQKLEPTQVKWVALLFISLFAVFWNGIISVFVHHALTGGGGWGRIAMGIFMIPFVIIGIGLVVFAVYTLLTMFNPTVEIALSNGAVPLGGEVDLAWEVKGNVRRIRNLKIDIKGTESATYQRGTKTYTDTDTFKELLVVSTGTPDEIRFGSTTVTIPETTMHTLEAGQNQIKWTVDVVGDIPFWPDIRETFGFRVKP